MYQTGKLWATIIVAILAAGVFLQRTRPELDCPRPDYPAAQRNTVIISTVPASEGSGILIRRGNRLFAWTAAHVIEGALEVEVRQFFHFDGHKAGEMRFPARVIWANRPNDYALLWVDAPATLFTGVEFSDTVPLAVGTPVFHVGNFLGSDYDNSVSVGIISQVGVNPAQNWPWEVTDQTDLTVAGGSSGGGIFNMTGQVVGILVGGPHRGDFGFNHFMPVRVIAEDEAIRWALWGAQCPPDEVLKLAAKKFSNGHK